LESARTVTGPLNVSADLAVIDPSGRIEGRCCAPAAVANAANAMSEMRFSRIMVDELVRVTGE
jgi:hypothetical protein